MWRVEKNVTPFRYDERAEAREATSPGKHFVRDTMWREIQIRSSGARMPAALVGRSARGGSVLVSLVLFIFGGGIDIAVLPVRTGNAARTAHASDFLRA